MYAVEFQLTPSRRATYKNTIFICQRTFQLTPSRRATQRPLAVSDLSVISTHALTEGDFFALWVVVLATYFNSRPHGGRHIPLHFLKPNFSFQLTPSRRATVVAVEPFLTIGFQLTPSRRATKRYHRIPSFSEHFNSRPHGGRRFRLCRMHLQTYFNSRPHGGRLEIVRSLG